MSRVENLQTVLSAVQLEIQQNQASRERLESLEALLQQEIDDIWASGVASGAPNTDTGPEPEQDPGPEAEPVDYEELRRLATHRALNLLRKGEKEAVVQALAAAGGQRVTELTDEQLPCFLEALEGVA